MRHNRHRYAEQVVKLFQHDAGKFAKTPSLALTTASGAPSIYLFPYSATCRVRNNEELIA